MTLEEQVKALQLQMDRQQAYIDCCNVIGRYVCYHAADEQDKIASLFATKTEGCRIEMMSGVFEGDDGIEAFFHSHPNSDDDENRKGFLHIHMLTTPIVEVAADGESVVGSWYSPGVESNTFGGTLNGFWAWMKYGAVFKKEDGVWKIWHLHTYSIFMCPYDKCWTEVEPYGQKKEIPPEMLEMMKKEMDAKGMKGPGGPGGFGGGPMYTPKPATTWWGFSKDAMYPGDQPTPPTPYDTLDPNIPI